MNKYLEEVVARVLEQACSVCEGFTKQHFYRLQNGEQLKKDKTNLPRALYQCSGCDSFHEYFVDAQKAYRTNFQLLNLKTEIDKENTNASRSDTSLTS